MERDELAQRRAINELAKLFVLFGLNAEAAKTVAKRQIQRATFEVCQTLSPLDIHAV